MQINFLSHFLMISELLDGMRASPDPRVIMVGSVTGNDNTVGGGGVYPIADLKDLKGFKAGFENPVAMADGYGFIGAKAYKDSKLCLMMMSNFLHSKFNRSHGITFSSIYPGCIAETPLFREKRPWFRKYFPVFMKYITGGYVGVEEAGQRLFQVAHDPRCSKSGVYWSWNGGPREGRGAAALEKGGQISGGGGAGGGWDSIYINDQSDKVNNLELCVELFQCATKITGAQWPEAKTFTSPCPTLKVISAISTNMIAREELKRMAVSFLSYRSLHLVCTILKGSYLVSLMKLSCDAGESGLQRRWHSCSDDKAKEGGVGCR
jgi:protochlorophyllide reductase